MYTSDWSAIMCEFQYQLIDKISQSIIFAQFQKNKMLLSGQCQQ